MSNPHKAILITRPAGQGESLMVALREAGWHCHHQPLLRICPIESQHASYQQLKEHILNLDRYEVIISVSGNASKLAYDWIDQYWPQLPIDIQWLAVGPSSAKDLEKLGAQVRVPQHSHSEGLLALPQLNSVQGKRILILRGVGGRELLAQQLTARGAQVSYCELYERENIPFSPDYFSQLLSEQNIGFALITSGEMAQQLQLQLNGSSFMDSLHLLVPSERICTLAKSLGFKRVHVCPQISPAPILNCLEALIS